jgi:hypothetical protein
LAIGYRDDLSFVVRGDMIGVFKAGNKGSKKLQFMTSITGIGTPDGKKGFQPSKVRWVRVSADKLTVSPRSCCTSKTGP